MFFNTINAYKLISKIKSVRHLKLNSKIYWTVFNEKIREDNLVISVSCSFSNGHPNDLNTKTHLLRTFWMQTHTLLFIALYLCFSLSLSLSLCVCIAPPLFDPFACSAKPSWGEAVTQKPPLRLLSLAAFPLLPSKTFFPDHSLPNTKSKTLKSPIQMPKTLLLLTPTSRSTTTTNPCLPQPSNHTPNPQFPITRSQNLRPHLNPTHRWRQVQILIFFIFGLIFENWICKYVV